MHNPEYRSKPRSGRDRSVNKLYARTTDKGSKNLRRYSLLSRDNLKEKRELTNRGTLIVPFRTAQASSVAFGSLTASNDIAESTYTRGTITDKLFSPALEESIAA